MGDSARWPVLFFMNGNAVPFDSLKKSIDQWQDNRRAENNARYDTKHGVPTTKVLNQRLIEALDKGWHKTAAQALEQGASADARHFYEYGLSQYTYPILSREVMRDRRANIDLILQHAPDLDTQDSFTGHTALMEAVIRGNTPVVRLLLDAGAKLDIRSSIHSPEKTKATALDIAAERGYDDIEEMLKAEPQRRQAAAKAAQQAAAEAAQKAAQKAAEPETPPTPAEIVVKTDKSIAVSEPIRFKNHAKPKKWFQF